MMNVFTFFTNEVTRLVVLAGLIIAGLAACGGNQGSADATLSTPAVVPSAPIAPVTTPDTPPTISGQPNPSVNVGSAYAFVPTAVAANGNTLTFSIQNKPAWATFNTTSGAPTGTPTAADVGSYANIIISVSDGTGSASLPPFTLTVQQISNGTATLDWTPPTENTDGTTLTNLAGYHLHYGMTADNLTQSAQLANAGLTRYALGNLSTGTWYFRISAYTTAGVESAVSPVVSDTIL
jgi:hypothetical protein